MSYYQQGIFVRVVSPDIYQYLHMNSLFLRCVLECQAHRTIFCISVISTIEPWIFSGVSNAGFSIDRGTEGMAAWRKMPSASPDVVSGKNVALHRPVECVRGLLVPSAADHLQVPCERHGEGEADDADGHGGDLRSLACVRSPLKNRMQEKWRCWSGDSVSVFHERLMAPLRFPGDPAGIDHALPGQKNPVWALRTPRYRGIMQEEILGLRGTPVSDDTRRSLLIRGPERALARVCHPDRIEAVDREIYGRSVSRHLGPQTLPIG